VDVDVSECRDLKQRIAQLVEFILREIEILQIRQQADLVWDATDRIATQTQRFERWQRAQRDGELVQEVVRQLNVSENGRRRNDELEKNRERK
jgi:hypothetical protein